MPTFPAGSTAPLTAQFYQYPGGPGQDVTGLTITITQLVGTVVVLGPTSAGIGHVAAGLYAYDWAIPGDADPGTYAVVWNGTVAGDPVQASELVDVGVPQFTTDPATDVGRVRLLISDVDPARPCFTDAEIGAFLALESGSVRLAAAQALDTIASNEALMSKVVTALDVSTDGAKVAAELRARAAGLRAQAAAQDPDASGEPFAFDTVCLAPRRFYPPYRFIGL